MHWTGIAASDGVAVGRAYLLPGTGHARIPGVGAATKEREAERLEAALQRAADSLQAIHHRLVEQSRMEEADIIAVQLALLQDEEWGGAARQRVQRGDGSALAAIEAVTAAAVADIVQLTDPDMRERASDIEDVCRRVIQALQGEQGRLSGLSALPSEGSYIIIGDDLSPSEAVQLDPARVAGFVTAGGGGASHAAIIARSLGIPAVVGVGPCLFSVEPGQWLLLDGTAGKVACCAEPGPQREPQGAVESAGGGARAAELAGGLATGQPAAAWRQHAGEGRQRQRLTDAGIVEAAGSEMGNGRVEAASSEAGCESPAATGLRLPQDFTANPGVSQPGPGAAAKPGMPRLLANIGSVREAEAAAALGAGGIGLFRTELLFMGWERFPNEQEQYEAYLNVAEQVGGCAPVAIRTMDAGGDKQLPLLYLPYEDNPLLGMRGIRISLQREDLFRTQIRAVLRASVHNEIRLLFPMIATLGELQAAKGAVERAKGELHAEGIAFNPALKVGMMVEVPAVALMIDRFAPHVDFFSLGTNDLVQYIMAASRTAACGELYDPLHPAVLRLLQQVIHAAHAAGKPVGVCGEMAGDEAALPVLVGMGVDELSVGTGSLAAARERLLKLSVEECRAVVGQAMACDEAWQVRQLLAKGKLPARSF